MNQHDLASALLSICQQASAEILKVYQRDDFSIAAKADHSPVTAADLAAHQVIQTGLCDLTPEIPQLSEEDTELTYQQRKVWQKFWCIDPLDGTKEFINRNDEFTINISLIENNRPIFGIIYVPVSTVAYWGGNEIGAWKQENGQAPAQIRSRPLGKELIVASSRRHGQEVNENLILPIAKQFSQISHRGMGSSLKMCLIAEGMADFYPRLYPTSEWDTAAAQAILEAAGGRLVNAKTLEGLTYNLRESLENPYFFACGDPQFPLEVLRNHLASDAHKG
ncbi:3'(2'),5'-bisphosphate nucleotidase CysQ [Neptuniibacter sp. QD34_54]|uniref:3'(2'),5'-bisphosphate nucleotidase CysQ n=1 Tax=Neptuniibacter sp. QD34_54 TaxID=3398208 RepID=UPI0039F5538F